MKKNLKILLSVTKKTKKCKIRKANLWKTQPKESKLDGVMYSLVTDCLFNKDAKFIINDSEKVLTLREEFQQVKEGKNGRINIR